MRTLADFTNLVTQLRSVSGKLDKTALVSDFLQTLETDELLFGPLFLLGRAFPDTDSRSLNVSWRKLSEAVKELPLPAVANSSRSLLQLSSIFEQIAATTGKGSQQRVRDLLRQIFAPATEPERRVLTNLIFGEMRIGVAEGLLLDSIAAATGVSGAAVRRANMYLGHPGEVLQIAMTTGLDGLQNVQLKLFRPVQPMLASLAEDFAIVFKEHGGQTSLEFKYDGARVQIHKSGAEIRIYSRQLSDVTASLPEVVKMIAGIDADTAVVEGELVAVSAEGRPLPFQELMRRFRRVHNIEALIEQVPVRLFLFDLLYLNKQAFVDEPYSERIRLLKQVCAPDLITPSEIVADVEKADLMLASALKAGHEGLMAKRLDSVYRPGTRGKLWFKIKPAETLDLVIVAADWGSGRRQGWLSNYHLAARDEETGEYLLLGKTFKGLTDQQFKWMTARLQELKTRASAYTVFVKPEIVVEVAYNEIQRSPRYNSRFALRFARIKRIRDDKSPDQADKMARVRQLFEKQFLTKAKSQYA